jgi:serine/threonine-protein kinase PRP4
LLTYHSSGQTSEVIAEIPAESEPLDEAALIEQRRKRREAIKAKYGRSGTPMLVQALHIEDKSVPGTPGRTQLGEEDNQSTRSGKSPLYSSSGPTDPSSIASPVLSTPATPVETQDSPPEFAITNNDDLANKNGDIAAAAEEDGPSAADYDPTVDMREDQRRDDQRHHDDVPSSAYEETAPTSNQAALLPEPVAPAKEKVKKSKDDFDMFAEGDDDDMFAEESPVQIRVEDDVTTNQESSIAVPTPQGKELDISMLDNWDDPEGYYKIILGELLNGRYHVQTKLGRGMFSDVVRATDATTKKLVAIKIIRNNDTM